MSLLDKASLIVTPNAYKASKLYSVVPSDGTGDMTVVRATTATRVNSSSLIESVAINIPRIDYTNGSCPSLLVEPQRTNLALNSDGNVSTYPTAINVTNASSSFNSFVNAIQFPSTALALAYKSVVTTAQTYAISVFIKMDDNSVPILSASQTTGNLCLVIAGNIATNNLKVESYGNNVYRLSATATSLAVNVNNGVIRYDTQVLKSFKITGIQLEAASYPTSYIPTVASSVTRNADVISKTGISSLINSQEGVLFVDLQFFTGIGNIRSIHISNGDNNNRIGFYGHPSVANRITFAISSGGVITDINFNGVTLTNRNKVLIRYSGTTFTGFVNGVKSTNQTFTPFAANFLNRIGLDYGEDILRYEGRINSIQLYKTALTDAECIALTTL